MGRCALMIARMIVTIMVIILAAEASVIIIKKLLSRHSHPVIYYVNASYNAMICTLF